MKKLISILIAGAFIFCLAGMSFAQGGSDFEKKETGRGIGAGKSFDNATQKQRDQWSGSDQKRNDSTGKMGTEQRRDERKTDYMEDKR